MRVYVDDQEWKGHSFSEEKTVLWKEITQQVARVGRVPCEICVDGEILEQEAFTSLSGGGEVRIRTKPLRELLRESLEQAEQYVPALLGGLGAVADKFEAEESREALALLQQASEGMEWLLKIIENAQILSGIENGEIGDGGLVESRKQLTLILQAVVTSLEEGKYFEAAYKIREELMPIVVRMGTYVGSISRFVGNHVQ